MNTPIIEITNITKSYQENIPVLKDISLSIPRGAFVTIIGPSGCGKTTLLRLINAMTGYSNGQLKVMGKNIDAWDKIELRRSIGYVIQQGGLFPHLTIRENMEFVLKLSKTPRHTIDQRITTLTQMMGFDAAQLDAYPENLSGGQQQRVGVARALSSSPEIVLMDEPFGALDNITRRMLQKEIKAMHRQSELTFVLVTHDINEAFTLGTSIAIMNEGIIEQYDTPEIIRKYPASDWVKNFVTVETA